MSLLYGTGTDRNGWEQRPHSQPEIRCPLSITCLPLFFSIRAIGLIFGFGVVQVGLSLKSHDPSQRANGFLTLAGGVIITFAKEIFDLIMA